MKIAACLIVKGSDEEAKVLDQALDSVRPYVDDIFITRTQLPNEAKNAAVGQISAKYDAILSDFEWVYDFAEARNYNFSQVPKEYDYIIWMDADDAYRGLEKLRKTIEENPDVDGFGLWYLYGWDEYKKPVVVHRKTMVVKNDGCVSWKGAIHEDLQENRQLNIKIIDGIDRLHLSDDSRALESKDRNLVISKKALDQNPDDPRNLWNLGNSYYGLADIPNARKAFEQFIEESESEQEKYMAHQRLADVERASGDNRAAIRHLQIDIGIAPSIPDAYLQLAYQYFTMGDMEKAEMYSLQGLMRRPQPNGMIVYNPRDYDYNPMMLLARVYSQKNRPDLMLPLLEGCLKIYPDDASLKQMVEEGKKEKEMLGKALEKIKSLEDVTDLDVLKKELDALPEELRSHPAIAVLRNKHFVKKESSGSDLVIYCGYTAQVWNSDTFKTEGIGGSEEAVIHLAREYAKAGWDVTVYNNCGHRVFDDIKIDPPRESQYQTAGGITINRLDTAAHVTYRPYWEFNHNDKQDVVIVWRTPKPVDAQINCGKIFIDMHDVLPPGEFTEARLEKITKVMFKSQAHRDLFPNVPEDKACVVHNGFQSYSTTAKKDPYLLINTSSPDRSMDVLPALFKRVRERVPKAKMKWAYGWNVYKSSHSGNPKMMKWMEDINKSMEDAGIENLGKLTQQEVGELYGQASILAYPTEFFEISCISVLKAQAAGCVPVTTDFAALKESNVFGVQIPSTKTSENWARPYQFSFGLEDKEAQDKWVEAVVKQLKNPKKIDEKKLEAWSKSYSWSEIAKQWVQNFK